MCKLRNIQSSISFFTDVLDSCYSALCFDSNILMTRNYWKTKNVSRCRSAAWSHLPFLRLFSSRYLPQIFSFLLALVVKKVLICGFGTNCYLERVLGKSLPVLDMAAISGGACVLKNGFVRASVLQFFKGQPKRSRFDFDQARALEETRCKTFKRDSFEWVVLLVKLMPHDLLMRQISLDHMATGLFSPFLLQLQ